MDHIELKPLGDNVYVAYGKVLWVDDPSVDVSTDVGRKDVLFYMLHMFESKLDPRPFGMLSAGVMLPKTMCPDGIARHVGSCIHFGDFSEPVKEKLRKEFPEYASEIY